MSKVLIYTYAKCQTCRKAVSFLKKEGIVFIEKDIISSPPSKNELETMLVEFKGEIKKLFNTSGEVYREMKLSEKLSGLSSQEAIHLLASNGKLIKRPFLLLNKSRGSVGFNEEVWRKLLG